MSALRQETDKKGGPCTTVDCCLNNDVLAMVRACVRASEPVRCVLEDRHVYTAGIALLGHVCAKLVCLHVCAFRAAACMQPSTLHIGFSCLCVYMLNAQIQAGLMHVPSMVCLFLCVHVCILMRARVNVCVCTYVCAPGAQQSLINTTQGWDKPWVRCARRGPAEYAPPPR